MYMYTYTHEDACAIMARRASREGAGPPEGSAAEISGNHLSNTTRLTQAFFNCGE